VKPGQSGVGVALGVAEGLAVKLLVGVALGLAVGLALQVGEMLGVAVRVGVTLKLGVGVKGSAQPFTRAPRSKPTRTTPKLPATWTWSMTTRQSLAGGAMKFVVLEKSRLCGCTGRWSRKIRAVSEATSVQGPAGVGACCRR
jgi:hypothetical protein